MRPMFEKESFITYKKEEPYDQLLSSIEEQENQGGLSGLMTPVFDSEEEAEAFERRCRERYGRNLPNTVPILIATRVNKPEDLGR